MDDLVPAVQVLYSMGMYSKDGRFEDHQVYDSSGSPWRWMRIFGVYRSDRGTVRFCSSEEFPALAALCHSSSGAMVYRPTTCSGSADGRLVWNLRMADARAKRLPDDVADRLPTWEDTPVGKVDVFFALTCSPMAGSWTDSAGDIHEFQLHHNFAGISPVWSFNPSDGIRALGSTPDYGNTMNGPVTAMYRLDPEKAPYTVVFRTGFAASGLPSDQYPEISGSAFVMTSAGGFGTASSQTPKKADASPMTVTFSVGGRGEVQTISVV